MNIELISIGKTRTGFVVEGLQEYCGRLKRYCNFIITELPDVRNAGKMSESEQKENEGYMILNRLSPSDHVVILDEHGKQYTSKKFAIRLQTIMASGKKRLVFVIGGPYGFSEKVYSRADELLSLSEMTFNHEMVRLFFTEQLYRANTILRGEPYHHE